MLIFHGTKSLAGRRVMPAQHSVDGVPIVSSNLVFLLLFGLVVLSWWVVLS